MHKYEFDDKEYDRFMVELNQRRQAEENQQARNEE